MNHLDPVNVFISIITLALGPAIAAVLGPYAVILLASTIGAAWSLGRREPFKTRSAAASYFMLMNGTALLVTVSIANGIGHWIGQEDASWLLAPVALFIGGVGYDWPRLLRWALRRFIVFRTGGKGDAQ